MKTVGDRIREKREALGLTQEELAKRLGYKSRSSVNKMENSRELPIKKVERMAEILGCTPAYLMGWEENSSSNIYDAAAKKVADILKESTNATGLHEQPLMPGIHIVEPNGKITFSKYNEAVIKLVYEIMDLSEKGELSSTTTTNNTTAKSKKNSIYVPNPFNKSQNDDIVPFPQYPGVTKKDIQLFAARNAKKNFSEEEIAEMIYEMRKGD